MQVLMHRYVKVCTLSLTWWWFASNLVSGGRREARRTRSTSTPRVASVRPITSAGVAVVRDERPSSTRALSSLPPKIIGLSWWVGWVMGQSGMDGSRWTLSSLLLAPFPIPV
ncbi:hypothetical protein B9Z19DRAFT_1084578, partial [Tuber borchii]